VHASNANLNERERYWQDFYDVIGENGLNCRLTITTDKSGRFSEETKLKISKAGIGRIHSEETKKKIALSNIGWNHSSETKKKLSKQKLGKTLSDEHRAKIKQGLDRRYGRIINDCS